MGARREKALLGGGGVDGAAPSATPDPSATPALDAVSVASAPVAAISMATATTGAAAAVYDEK